ncbi:hypothetical protein [Nocardia sp. NPDC050413]|uniref:hypothetical protein n=1 Tax=Nocardia sp. NPDC050413 TaxID=3155784 RepID=UPI003411138D
MNNERGEVIVVTAVRDGEREVRIEIGEPRHDTSTHDWLCTYRVGGSREHKVRGPNRLAAVYAALVEVEDTATRVDLPNGAAAGQPRTPALPRLLPNASGAGAADPRAFGPPLGARAVQTSSGPVVVTIARPRRDPNRPHTYLCPFRIDDRTEAFGQGPDDIRAVMSAIRSVGAILGLPRNWPTSTT